MHFLLFSPVLLVSTLRFMTAYVTPGLVWYLKERKEKRIVLFPVCVDKAVFESPFDWATEIHHERNIGDFTRWKDHDEYQKVFDRLLRDLQAQWPQ